MRQKNDTRFYITLAHPKLRILRFSDPRLHVSTHILTALLMLAVVLAPAAAWSYQTYVVVPQLSNPLEFSYQSEDDIFADEISSVHPSSPPSSPAVTDLCLPLLRSIQINPNAVTDRTQRTAGTAAAHLSVISLALGVRYALGPVEFTGSDTGTKDSPNQKLSALANANNAQALAVSRYRDCHKQQALKTLGSSAGRSSSP